MIFCFSIKVSRVFCGSSLITTFFTCGSSLITTFFTSGTKTGSSSSSSSITMTSRFLSPFRRMSNNFFSNFLFSFSSFLFFFKSDLTKGCFFISSLVKQSVASATCCLILYISSGMLVWRWDNSARIPSTKLDPPRRRRTK